MKLSWTQEQLAQMLRYGQLRKFPKGQILFSEGDRPNDVYYINKGWVNIYRMTHDGRRVSVAIRGKGQFIGIAELFRSSGRDCYAEALEDVEIYVVGADNLKAVIRDNPDLNVIFLDILANRLHEAHTTLLDFACNQAPRRMAITILNMLEQEEVKDTGKVAFPINLTQEEMATIIGSSRQVVNGLLRTLKEKGCVELQNGRIKAVYPEKIRKYLLG